MREPGPWSEEVADLTRGAAGGLVFGVPLLYTLEVWEAGKVATPARLLAGLALGFLPVLLLVLTSGFRERPSSAIAPAVDAVTSFGWSLLLAAVVLLVLGRIEWPLASPGSLGTIVFAGIPFAIGFAVASEMFGRGDGGEGREFEGRKPSDRTGGTLLDLASAGAGALFLGLSIAPTEEVAVLAAGLEGGQLTALVAASLVASYGIVFVADFHERERRRTQAGVLQHPITETVASYVIALAVSAALLAFFDNLFPAEPGLHAVGRVVVLGFPAAIGGAAGRLVV